MAPHPRALPATCTILRSYPLVYLATPYTKHRDGIGAAFIDAAKCAAKLVKEHVKVYSPIAHTHPIAIFGGMDPRDHALWLPFDETMMNLSAALVVATMDGWRESYGVNHEIVFFEKARKPIFLLDPHLLDVVPYGAQAESTHG